MADRKEKARLSKITVRRDAATDAIDVRLKDGRYARTEEIDDYR